MSTEQEKRQRAVHETAKMIKENSRGKITSEQAHREAVKIAQRVNRKKDG